jgi:quercetin dioxygenase-like cupin family protein
MGQIIHHFADHLYAKETVINAGEHLLQHVHGFSHLSVLAKGKVVVTTEEGQQILEGPTCLEIKAGLHHGVKALTDTVWYCIHATDEKNVDKIDEVIISGSSHKEGE